MKKRKAEDFKRLMDAIRIRIVNQDLRLRIQKALPDDTEGALTWLR